VWIFTEITNLLKINHLDIITDAINHQLLRQLFTLLKKELMCKYHPVVAQEIIKKM